MVSTAQQVDDTKEYQLHVLTNNKTYIFLSSKIVSSSISSFIKLINSFHQNCLLNVFLLIQVTKKSMANFLLDKVDFLYPINIDIP